jgi:hypothetical protein
MKYLVPNSKPWFLVSWIDAVFRLGDIDPLVLSVDGELAPLISG